MVDETTTGEVKPAKKRPPPEGEKAVRVPVELLDRALKLLPKLQATPWGDAVRWNETALVRLALARGLAVLEGELATDEARKRPAAKPTKKRPG